MEVHPAAAVWPMLPDDEMAALADDIKANGLHHPVVLTPDRQVLDGRNRLAACKLAGVKPTYVTHDGDPVAYVLSMNAKRRHVSKGQNAMATVLTALTAGVNNLQPDGSLANDAGVSRPMILWARTVAEHSPSLAPRVLDNVEPMALRDAYDDAVKIRDKAEGVDGRIAKLPEDLRTQVKADTLTLAGAEAEHAERKRLRARAITEGEDSARKLLGIAGHVAAAIGAVQEGSKEIDLREIHAEMMRATDAVDHWIDKWGERNDLAG